MIVGIVTDIDLLHYIARHEAGSGTSGDQSPDGSDSPGLRKSSSEASN